MASVGKPRKLESPEQMEQLAEQYFKDCDAKGEPYLLTGLCLALGLCSKQSFYEYEKLSEYGDSVKRLRLRVESGYERRLNSTTPTGPLFALKNMGWSDKQDIGFSGNVTLSDPGRSNLSDEQLKKLIALAESQSIGNPEGGK